MDDVILPDGEEYKTMEVLEKVRSTAWMGGWEKDGANGVGDPRKGQGAYVRGKQQSWS